MPETTRFSIGAEVTGTDGSCGEVDRVVIDPVAKAVTHLVVVPRHRGDIGRLVPLELVDMATGEVRLRCTVGEFERLDPVEETQFRSEGGSYAGYDSGHVLPWPHYALGNPMGMGMASAIGFGSGEASQRVTYDTVPLDEVQVRRGDQVLATDGDIGKVQGLVIDPRNHQVTHLLLQEGHLWGRRQVAIPISAVTLSGAGGIGLNFPRTRCGTCRRCRSTPPGDPRSSPSRQSHVVGCLFRSKCGPEIGGSADKDLVDQVVEAAQRVVASGTMSANGHGNVSVRVPGTDEMYFTGGPSLRNHPASAVVRVRLDGMLLEGDLPPIQAAVVAMHTAMYADQADVGCVLHTHSPYATAHAVAKSTDRVLGGSPGDVRPDERCAGCPLRATGLR